MKPETGRWPRAYLWLIGGFAALILTANAIMVTVALNSWRGLHAEEPYIQGLNYNDELARRSAEDALGWRLDVAVEQTGPHTLSIAITPVDNAGRVLTAAEISGTLVRPTQEGMDVPFRLAPTGSAHEAAVALPEQGVWDMRLTVAAGDDRLRHHERVFLAP